MRYAELFAGAGGLSLGLDRAGFECAWHAEIADFPRRVLKHHWPDTPLYGDVSQLDGRKLVERHGPIDLLSGGSPCQDLSVAGKRAGMTEGSGTRSSLFYEQLRLWNETGAEFLLWENVDGARSSNEGKDFGSVLSAIVGAPVFVPSDGWRSGGVAVGPSGIAAWRVLDAQYFGVPQRRRRVFVLCSRTCRVDPAEILSLSEGLRGNTAPSGEAREGLARSAGNGVEGEGCLVGWDNELNASESVIGALKAGEKSGQSQYGVLSFAQNQRGELRLSEVSTSLNSGGGKPGEGYPAILAFENHGQDSRFNQLDKSFPAINGQAGTGGNNLPLALAFSAKDSGADVGEISPTPRAGGHTESHANGGVMPAVLVANETGHEAWRLERVAGSPNAHESKEAHSLIVDATINGHQRQQVDAPMVATHGIPRRLMPIECERLMGWPDNWTDVPDEKGKPASDAARYKACGNGVVSHCVQWIGERLRDAV